ncbi:MAG: alginate lyase family protein [Desulfomonilaceae bacterium]
MNLDIWKYRYRRLRTLSLVDLRRRLEIRSWRRQVLDFVNKYSAPITSSSIDEWMNCCVTSGQISEPGQKRLKSRLSSGMPQGFLNDPDFWNMFQSIFPQDSKKLVSLAEDVLQGHIQLFGWKTMSLPIPSLEPQDNQTREVIGRWETSNYWDINFYHSKTRPNFDVKWLWELQRFQFLLWLGAAWRLTGDNKFASTAREILESWFSRLKYPLGVEWSSNLEVGLRLLSFSRCTVLCMDSPAWDPEFMSTLFAWNRLHATHLRKEITLHHTLGNHQLGEASSLMWFALVYPGLKESESRKTFSLRTINELVPKLIYSDGVYTEQSTGYLKFVLEFMLPLFVFPDSVNGCFSPTTSHRIISSLEFIQALSDCGQATPMIGDSDSGSAIGWRLTDYSDFSWLLAAGSILFNRPNLAAGIQEYPSEAFLITGLEGLDKFNKFDRSPIKSFGASKAKRAKKTDFPVGGYHVSNDSYFQMVFDSGPLGIYPGYGHGHADALSIIMSIENKPMIVDTGTLHYNAELKFRRYFRQTVSHNTLLINSTGQAKELDTFKWVSGYRVRWIDVVKTNDIRFFSGELVTNSYVHQREVLHAINKGFIIFDRVWTQGNALVEGHFHLHPDVNIQCYKNNKFIVSDGNDLFELILFRPSYIYSEVFKGSKNPMLGWYSGSYGHMVPSWTVRFCLDISNRGELVTIIQRPGLLPDWIYKCDLAKFS